jgi:hypothetical protein
MRILICALAVVVSACGPAADLRSADAASDARAAIAKGDARLLGVAGFSVEVPGVALEVEQAEQLYGVRVVERTGDVYENGVSKARNEKARRYAALYNKAVVTALPPEKRN